MSQERLLDIAVSEFGAKGPDGASTRGIAAAAGTAMSSITYHYGGKEGLYLAAADHVAESMAHHMASALIAERDIGRDDREGARRAVHRILGRLIQVVASDATRNQALFMLREQLAPSDAFDRIYAGLLGQALERLTELVCIATGRPDRRAAGIAVLALTGQVVAIRAMRGSVLRLLDQSTLDVATVTEFKDRLDQTIDATLDTMQDAGGRA